MKLRAKFNVQRSTFNVALWTLYLFFWLLPILAFGAGLPEPSTRSGESAERSFAQGLTLKQAGRFEEAAKSFRKAILLDPRRPEAYAKLREVYGRKKIEELIQELEKAKARDKDDFISRNLLGVLYAKKRLWQQAVASLQEALRIQPQDVDALTNLGWIFTELKRYEEARQKFQEALRLRPDYARAHAGLGGIYAEADRDWKAAIAEYLKALHVEPENATYLSDLAWAYYQAGQVDRAIEVFRKAIALKPDYVVAHANLGWAYLKKGEVEAAAAHFQEALNLDPNSPFARFGFAKALEALGREAEAAGEYQKAWRLSKNDLYLLYLVGIYLRRYLWTILAVSAVALLVTFSLLIRGFRKAMEQGPL